MRKNIFKQSWAQKVVAVGLCAAMTVPSSAAYLGTVTTALAADDLPTPVAVYEADSAVDVDTEGTNKPTVESVDGLWEGATAWTLSGREDATDTGDTTETATTVTHNDSSISVANPLIGDTDLVEDVSVNEDGRPVWNTAVTITYWVKTNGDYETPSALISFKGENVKTYHKNDVQKHRIASQYTEGAENDPTSEFYYRVIGTLNGKTVYDFYEYDMNKGITDPGSYLASSDFTQKKEATPQFISASPGLDLDNSLVYRGSYNSDGTHAEAFTTDNCKSITKSYFYQESDNFVKSFTYTDYLDLETSQKAEFGYVNGMLQLRTDGSIMFCQDTTKADRYTLDENGEAVLSNANGGLQENNKFLTSNAIDDIITADDDAEWHYIAYVIKNDQMCYYVDGECVDVIESFQSIDAGKSFNLGAMLKGTVTEKYLSYNPNANAMTIMEWLTADTTTTLNIGGVNMAISTTWDGLGAAYPTVEGTQIARVKVYDVELTQDEVQALYDAMDETTTVTYGDVTGDGEVKVGDALGILRYVVGLDTLEGTALEAADVNGDDTVNVQDALGVLKYVVGLVTELPIPASGSTATATATTTTSSSSN